MINFFNFGYITFFTHFRQRKLKENYFKMINVYLLWIDKYSDPRKSSISRGFRTSRFSRNFRHAVKGKFSKDKSKFCFYV